MAQLFFKGYLQRAIREGRKNTTVRRWPRAPFEAGSKAYSPGLGWLLIDSVEVVELANLTDSDALADGFDSLKAMRGVLDEIYPDHATDGKCWFRVNFRLGECIPARHDDSSQPQLF